MRTSVLILFVILTFYSCDPFQTILTEEDVEYFESSDYKKTAFPDTLKIMTWNIKFGGARIDFFFDCYGDRVIMTEEEVINNLNALSEKINQYDPDILFLQEVDMDSKRSAGVNQLKYILDKTNMNFGVFASQWKADYIPSNGIGKINSGNAILSKWEITNAVRISLPLFEDQNSIVRYFYLRRNILHAQLNEDNNNIDLITTHLSAYSHDGTKKKQLDILLDTLLSIDSEDRSFIVGGDFNCLPPGSKKFNDFPDSACEDEKFSADDFSEEKNWMDPFYRFTPAIPLDTYNNNNNAYFTHTPNSPERGSFWSRKLDYLFTNSHIVKESGLTHQDDNTGTNTMNLSDHCPVSFEVIIK